MATQLDVEDIRGIRSVAEVAGLFVSLGYALVGQPLDIAALELPADFDRPRAAYFLAEYRQRYFRQVVLLLEFEVKPSPTGASLRGSGINRKMGKWKNGKKLWQPGKLAKVRWALFQKGAFALSSFFGHVEQQRRISGQLLQPHLPIAVGVEGGFEAADG
jgi:hypothetical protein